MTNHPSRSQSLHRALYYRYQCSADMYVQKCFITLMITQRTMEERRRDWGGISSLPLKEN